MSIANLSVSSFASGVELKAALKKQNFELLLMDYHLGQGKTGVEWIQSLREAGFIRPSTGIIFLTSDRSPQIIGRIMDLQPDVLLIKPYTIASLTRQINHYLVIETLLKTYCTRWITNNLTEQLVSLELRSPKAFLLGLLLKLESFMRVFFSRMVIYNER